MNIANFNASVQKLLNILENLFSISGALACMLLSKDSTTLFPIFPVTTFSDSAIFGRYSRLMASRNANVTCGENGIGWYKGNWFWTAETLSIYIYYIHSATVCDSWRPSSRLQEVAVKNKHVKGPLSQGAFLQAPSSIFKEAIGESSTQGAPKKLTSACLFSLHKVLCWAHWARHEKPVFCKKSFTSFWFFNFDNLFLSSGSRTCSSSVNTQAFGKSLHNVARPCRVLSQKETSSLWRKEIKACKINVHFCCWPYDMGFVVYFNTEWFLRALGNWVPDVVERHSKSILLEHHGATRLWANSGEMRIDFQRHSSCNHWCSTLGNIFFQYLLHILFHDCRPWKCFKKSFWRHCIESDAGSVFWPLWRWWLRIFELPVLAVLSRNHFLHTTVLVGLVTGDLWSYSTSNPLLTT